MVFAAGRGRAPVHRLRGFGVQSDAVLRRVRASLAPPQSTEEQPMLKSLFNPLSIYQRRAQRCLDSARLAALEHETAAEFHAALGKMYRERAARLERELTPSPAAPSVILDTSTNSRVSALRRNDPRAGQAFLEQGTAAAS
jgi:phosphoribosylaminoimidazole (AIR) synthetase